MSKSKIPYEKKVEIARDYLEGRVGYTESLGRANNSKASFRYWVHQYQEKGSVGLLPSCKNHEYPEDIKRKAVEEYLSGKGSLEQIGGKYGLRSITQLRQWIKVYNAHGDFNSRKNSGGGSYMKQGRDTTQEERIQIVKDCLAGGKDYGEMALKLQGKLPAGTHMDAAVRGDGRGRSGGPARKEEEGSGAQNRAGESADRD